MLDAKHAIEVLLVDGSALTRREICQATGISESHVWRLLRDMVLAGALQTHTPPRSRELVYASAAAWAEDTIPDGVAP